jgi:uncharacterized protein
MDLPLILLCFFAFVAGFVDSIVGGGGLVQVPAFFILYPQLPVPAVIGANRFASAFGTVLFQLAIPMLVCNVAGSYLGSRMAVLRGNGFMRKVFLVVIAGIIARFAWDVLKPWIP